jgi:hypothetical protein
MGAPPFRVGSWTKAPGYAGGCFTLQEQLQNPRNTGGSFSESNGTGIYPEAQTLEGCGQGPLANNSLSFSKLDSRKNSSPWSNVNNKDLTPLGHKKIPQPPFCTFRKGGLGDFLIGQLNRQNRLN